MGSDLIHPDAWDAARFTAGPFALPETREDWERSATDSGLQARARDIASIIRQLDVRRLCSHGVGTATLELNVVREVPGLELICADFAPRTVERLTVIFPEARVLLRDLTDPDPPSADIHLMHRVDGELGDHSWRDVFEAIPEPVLFVPNTVLDVMGAAREVGRRVLKRGRLTAAGWFRNEDALRWLWAETHEDRQVCVGGARAFLLSPRRRVVKR